MDILIENTRIVKLGKELEDKADKTVDCTGLYIIAFIAPADTDFSSQCSDVKLPSLLISNIACLIVFAFDTGQPSSENATHPASNNGIIGFETALPATITNVVEPGYIDYMDIHRLHLPLSF